VTGYRLSVIGYWLLVITGLPTCLNGQTVDLGNGVNGIIMGYDEQDVRALGRNPSAAPKILQAMIISLVFAEAIAVMALLVLFQLFGRG
jgi:F0F1-type ATP synthase membrane subunit c/vacuolar-type H+-ATPase subunit K